MLSFIFLFNLINCILNYNFVCLLGNLTLLLEFFCFFWGFFNNLESIVLVGKLSIKVFIDFIIFEF